MNELPEASGREADVVHFSVDAGLLFELGQRLVGRRSVAVAELIKNSYDADATNVTVRFENASLPGGTIAVEDDGVGMTREQFEGAWMRIGTDDSRRRPLSAIYARHRSGAKGVGRLACVRLAREVEVLSVARDARGKHQRLHASLTWDAFADGQDVESVPIHVTVSESDGAQTTGTTLILKDLRESWTENDILALKNDLLDLVSPLPEARLDWQREGTCDPGFRFAIVAPEYPLISGDVGDGFLSLAWGVLSGELSEDGRASYTIDLRDKRRFVFSPPEPVSNRIHDASFRVHYFVYSGTMFSRSGFKLFDARNMGRERGGVRTYLDGFRVFAYGAPGDDWLNLDADRGRRLTKTPDVLSSIAAGLSRPMLLLPGNMQLFGAVALSRHSNPDVQVSLSRERFVENEAYDQLRAYVRLGIDWLTVVFARIRAQEKPEPQDNAAVGYSVPARIEQVREVLSKAAVDMDAGTRKELDDALRLVADQVRSHEEQRIGELSMLRVLASAGVLVAVLEHTLAGFVAEAEHVQSQMDRLRPLVLPGSVDEYERVCGELRSWSEVMREQSMLVGELLARDARTRPRRVAVRPIVDRVFVAFRVRAAEFGIDLVNNVSPDTRTPPMYMAEFMSIVVNLLTNAMKAVQSSSTRMVQIDAERHEDHLTFKVFDTGVGIPAEDREEIFKPFFSTSNPDPLLGVGTGLGLTIARDLARDYGGSIRVIDTEQPWVTCVAVELPEEGNTL